MLVVAPTSNTTVVMRNTSLACSAARRADASARCALSTAA